MDGNAADSLMALGASPMRNAKKSSKAAKTAAAEAARKTAALLTD